jgi:hypothetical protein
MWKTTRLHLDDNSTIWSTNTPFTNASTALTNAIAAADAAILGQTTTSTGVSADKETLELEAIEKVVAIGKSLTAYAIDTNNQELEAKVSATKRQLQRLPDNQLIQKLTTY